MPNYNIIVEVDFILLDNIYKVTNNLTNITSTKEGDITSETDFISILKANTGYKLPESIIVKVGNNIITNYNYNKETGELIIPASQITNNIEITAIAIKEDNIENPKTLDNIEISILISILSLLGLIITIKNTKNLI